MEWETFHGSSTERVNMEGLPIQNYQPTLDEMAKTSIVAAQQRMESINGPVPTSKPILGEVPVDSPEAFRMTQDSLHGVIESTLKASNLESTPANIEKIMNNLIVKFNDWVKSGDFVVRDITSKEAGQAYLDSACLRRGLPNNSESYAQIIKDLNNGRTVR